MLEHIVGPLLGFASAAFGEPFVLNKGETWRGRNQIETDEEFRQKLRFNSFRSAAISVGIALLLFRYSLLLETGYKPVARPPQ
jgi:hypothetical protein